MRTEEITKEAALFDHDNECYIHIQCCDGVNCALVTSGDPRTLLMATYNLICSMETDYALTFEDILKLLKRGRKYVLRQEKKSRQAA